MWDSLMEPSEEGKEGYENWLKEKQTNRVLEMISDRGTIDLIQASKYLGKSPEDTKKFLEELEDKKLIKRKIGDFYQLDFEGYQRVRRERSK